MPQPTPATRNPEPSLTQAERTARAHESMIAAAIGLLNTAGIQGTTLVAIGEKSGYSRGLATHHFGSKAGLFRAVLKHISAVWSEQLKQSLGDRTGLAAIETAIDAHLRHALEHPEYIRAQNILWGAALDPSSEFKPNVAEFMRIQRRSVAQWVRGGQVLGEIRPDLEAEQVAAEFYGGLVGLSMQWLVSGGFPLAPAYEAFKQNLVRLLRT